MGLAELGCAVFEEYDAGRADVMFVIQRVLEVDGKLTLLDSNKVIHPNPNFRLLPQKHCRPGITGLYHGTQQINQGRWNDGQFINILPRMKMKPKLSPQNYLNLPTRMERKGCGDGSYGDLTRKGLCPVIYLR